MQWLVLLGTTLGWALDGFAGSLYALVLGPAMTELLPNSDIVPAPANIGLYGGLTVALFLAGWATGSILFGMENGLSAEALTSNGRTFLGR